MAPSRLLCDTRGAEAGSEEEGGKTDRPACQGPRLLPAWTSLSTRVVRLAPTGPRRRLRGGGSRPPGPSRNFVSASALVVWREVVNSKTQTDAPRSTRHTSFGRHQRVRMRRFVLAAAVLLLALCSPADAWGKQPAKKAPAPPPTAIDRLKTTAALWQAQALVVAKDANVREKKDRPGTNLVGTAAPSARAPGTARPRRRPLSQWSARRMPCRRC